MSSYLQSFSVAGVAAEVVAAAAALSTRNSQGLWNRNIGRILTNTLPVAVVEKKLPWSAGASGRERAQFALRTPAERASIRKGDGRCSSERGTLVGCYLLSRLLKDSAFPMQDSLHLLKHAQLQFDLLHLRLNQLSNEREDLLRLRLRKLLRPNRCRSQALLGHILHQVSEAMLDYARRNTRDIWIEAYRYGILVEAERVIGQRFIDSLDDLRGRHLSDSIVPKLDEHNIVPAKVEGGRLRQRVSDPEGRINTPGNVLLRL